SLKSFAIAFIAFLGVISSPPCWPESKRTSYSLLTSLLGIAPPDHNHFHALTLQVPSKRVRVDADRVYRMNRVVCRPASNPVLHRFTLNEVSSHFSISFY